MDLQQESQEEASQLVHSEESPSYPKNGSNKKEGSDQFEVFKKKFEEQIDPESKLHLTLDFMQTFLVQEGTRHFAYFWEVRRFCLPLFKENISPIIRSQLWIKYDELSQEGRRLKELLDEQSAFAAEQIEIAIQALEKELSQRDDLIENTFSSEAETFSLPQELKERSSIYRPLQKQLDILNAQASRINALRKELLKTEMRVRLKNTFFQRLSLAGDQVFPKRKELIKQISQAFSDDVEHFTTKHFGEKGSRQPLYFLRDEIKTFQNLAKILTINTQSFTQTRAQLSECWDRIKVEERERKKERSEQRLVFKQNEEAIGKQIQTLKEAIEKREESPAEAQKKIEAIASQMRKTELGRDEVKILRESLDAVRKLIHMAVKEEQEERQNKENERERQKKEKYRIFKERAEYLLKEHELLQVETLVKDRETLLTEIQASGLTKNEKQALEHVLKPLRDIIADKKENALIALSEDDRQMLQHLKNILKERKERRQEIKNHLETLRKLAGSSNLDFEKAMNCKSQINEEKERFEKANQSIEEIETKISELS